MNMACSSFTGTLVCINSRCEIYLDFYEVAAWYSSVPCRTPPLPPHNTQTCIMHTRGGQNCHSEGTISSQPDHSQVGTLFPHGQLFPISME